MKSGQSLLEFATEIERRRTAKKDLIVPAPYIAMHTVPKSGAPDAERESRLLVAGGDSYAINGIAHGQIGDHCGIPAAYYKRMLAEAPELLSANVNRWLHETTDKRMVRTLDGTARAFLSDKFRPLENEDLAEAVLPVIQDLGLDVMSCQVTDKRLYIKVVDPSVTRALALAGAKFGDGSHTIVQQVSPAVTISNSEVGCGALSVLGGYYNGWCSNLASFGERSVRKYHVGKKHELVGDELYALLSPETRHATDKALWMQIREVVKIAFDRARFDQLIDKVEGTQADKIEGENVVQVVSLASKKFGVTEAESKSVLAHLIEGGQLNRFGLHNAFTRAAQDLESYDRATEFESIGGKVIELPKSEWHVLAKAA